MSPPPREWTLGPHLLRFEPPEVFWIRFQGPIELAEAKAAVAIYEEMSEARPFIFVAEMQQAGRFDSETARYLSENPPADWVAASVFVSSRLLHRALAKGIVLASRLSPLSTGHSLDKFHHVDTPAEARALIEQLRARLRGGGP